MDVSDRTTTSTSSDTFLSPFCRLLLTVGAHHRSRAPVAVAWIRVDRERAIGRLAMSAEIDAGGDKQTRPSDCTGFTSLGHPRCTRNKSTVAGGC
jgi:hypothetical protein